MSFKCLSKYRNVWVGTAMLWIVWFHSSLNVPIMWLQMIKDAGYGGVDICLFASGIGCYFSLHSDSDYYRFIKRRIARLMPVYICFILAWIPFKILSSGITFSEALGNLMCVQFFTDRGNDFNWYIHALPLFYLLVPLMKVYTDNSVSWRRYVLMVLFLLLFSVPFHTSDWLIVVTRFPVFYVGVVVGRFCVEERSISGKNFAGLIVAYLLGLAILAYCFVLYENLLWKYGLYWYPFLLIAPSACILCSALMSRIEKCMVGRVLFKGLDVIGRYSFEIYLIHIVVLEVLDYLFFKEWVKSTVLIWLMVILVIGIGCVVLRAVAEKVYCLLKRALKAGL